MGELVKPRDSSRLAGLALCCQEEERKGFPYIGSKGPALSILTIPCTLVEASKGHSIVELGTRRSSFPANKLYDLGQVICIIFADQ